jgi:gamma-glutamyltranspeptidase/glutathione hydrolase
MNFDPYYFPYPSRRQLTYAAGGMIASSQPLAAQTGLDILKKGGNAVDAAVAAAAAMTVLEPCSNGIGGDAFALFWSAGEGRLRGLNASGVSPGLLTEERIRGLGYDSMPSFGPIPITVPGIPAAWAAAAARYGRFPLEVLLEGAVLLAEEGFPLAPVTAKYWNEARYLYEKEEASPLHGGLKKQSGREELFRGWFSLFAPGGKTPEAGEMVFLRNHGAALREIGRTGAGSFYRGRIAAAIDRFMKETGGLLRAEDLASYGPEWVDPISVNYRGYDIWEIPPNGQGLVALLALNILENFSFPFGKDHPDTCHKQIEALKLAFADGHEYITDPRYRPVNTAGLLSKAYARERYALIGEEALEAEPGRPGASETVYLCTADREGNMVSWIQSNYMGFGSGMVLPEWGIAFQNRGFGFNLDKKSVKYAGPGKRPFHTIIPGFITKNGKPLGPFGIMGGAMQPQAHLQVVSNLVDFNLNPQAALDAPRWQWMGGKSIMVEQDFSPAILSALKRRGHEIDYHEDEGSFGRGQIIIKLPSGVLAGGTEKRTDGYIALW